jgi:hypothetical protein
MSEPFREADAPQRTFMVCPACQTAVEVEANVEHASCIGCGKQFAVSDAQTLVEHDAAARLVKALAPLPEDTQGTRRVRKVAIAAGVGAPIAMAGAGLLFGGTGLAIAALAIGGLLAVMNGVTRTDPYRDS